jgi:type II secretion system protein G
MRGDLTMHNRGFTLIELLVVVAIIAILAAIAVPNLLEAMTRAKVARVKSDMRTLANALETYRVDTNRYPPDSSSGVVPYLERLKRLTTPISYMASVPGDPFVDKAGALRYAIEHGGGINAYADPPSGENWQFPLTYDYAFRIAPDGTPESNALWANISRSPNQILWAIRSAGPDRFPAWLGRPEPAYDPTNGTVSRGNIYWTGPGRGEDGPIL